MSVIDMNKLRNEVLAEMIREHERENLFEKKIGFMGPIGLYNMLQDVNSHKQICLVDLRTTINATKTIRQAVHAHCPYTTSLKDLSDHVSKLLLVINESMPYIIVFGSYAEDAQTIETKYKSNAFQEEEDFLRLREPQLGLFLSRLSQHDLPNNKGIMLLKGGYEEFSKTYPFMTIEPEQNASFFRDYYPYDILRDFLFIGDGHNAASESQLEDLKIEYLLNLSSVPVLNDQEHNEFKQNSEEFFKKWTAILAKRAGAANNESPSSTTGASSSASTEQRPAAIPAITEPILLKKKGVKVLNLPTRDVDEFLLPFHEAIAFIHEAKKQKKRILVFCDTGRSVSCAIVIAYLVERTYTGNQDKMTVYAALNYIKRMIPGATINKGFMNQLLYFENGLQEKYQK